MLGRGLVFLGRATMASGRRRGRQSFGTFAQGLQQRPVRVLVDMDGVVADFENHLLTIYRTKYPDLPYVKLEDREGLYATHQYETLGDGLSDKVSNIINGPKYFREIPPIRHAIDAVKEMSSMEGVEVFFCTSQLTNSNYCVTDKLDWVTEHFGQDWTQRVIISHDKTLIQGDLLIDDKTNVGGTIRKPTWRQVLFTCCHNRRFDIAERPLIIARLDSWADKAVWKGLIEDCRRNI